MGCSAPQNAPEPFQGVVELEERTLAFELPGKLASVRVQRGDRVSQGQLLAALEQSLESSQRAIRAAEADVAQAQVSVVESGTRSEEIRAARARAAAAKSREEQLRRTLERERQLAERGVSTRAAVDDLESALSAAAAERRSLDEQAKALSRGARPSERDVAASRAKAAALTVDLHDEKLRRHRLEAPLAATVLDVHVQPGEIVNAAAPVVTLGDVTHPYADVFVPIGRLDGVRIGRAAEIRVDATPEIFPAVVEHVSRTTEFTPRYSFSERERPNLVVRVRLKIVDPEQRLSAGVPAFATLLAESP